MRAIVCKFTLTLLMKALEVLLVDAIRDLLVWLCRNLFSDVNKAFFLAVACFSESLSDEIERCRVKSEVCKKINPPALDLNLVMSRLGMGAAAEEEKISYSEEDLVALFEEEEPSLEELKEAFDVFDENKDGFIDCFELNRVLRLLEFRHCCDFADCKKMISAFDVNRDGMVDFREFLSLMERSLC